MNEAPNGVPSERGQTQTNAGHFRGFHTTEPARGGGGRQPSLLQGRGASAGNR